MSVKFFLGSGYPSVAYMTSVRWPSLKSVSIEAMLAPHPTCSVYLSGFMQETLTEGKQIFSEKQMSEVLLHGAYITI